MLSKYFTTPSLAAMLLLSGVAFTQTSCSRETNREVSAERDQAYNDFATFVSQTEANADAAANKAAAEYDQETTELKNEYDAKVAAVEKYNDQYDDTRRQEIEGLRSRYTTANDRRAAMRNNMSGTANGGTLKMGQYYKPTNPAAQLTAANARATYEAFVQNVKQNEERYDLDDWRYINAEWRALDEAYDKVKGNISANDLAEIQKEKLKYAAFKSWDKTQGRAAQGANAVSDEAREIKAETADERSKVGTAVSNTASDVKEAGKDVGRGAKKAGKKVGSAVKDVFDGNDKKKD